MNAAMDGSDDAGLSTSPKDKLHIIPLDSDPNRLTVAKQDKDPDSQLNYVRELLKRRKSSAALGNNGTLEFLGDAGHAYPMVYLRLSGNERYVVALNPSSKSAETTIASQGAKRATSRLSKVQAEIAARLEFIHRTWPAVQTPIATATRVSQGGKITLARSNRDRHHLIDLCANLIKAAV